MAMRDRLTAVALALALSVPAAAQQPAAARPAFKGVWEPVSFTEDIAFREVFFVTVDRGWVAGEKGTIIHTKDGGGTWTAQMGGDPQASEEPVKLLRFLDETHGWAVKSGRILRTEDGESWEDLGAAPQYIHELAMSSPSEGVAAGYLGMGRNPSTLLKTRDGGKTWKPVTMCKAKAMLGGLNRELGCEVLRIQFVTPSVGYLVARYQCAGMGCEPPPILGKTEDGGESWRFFVGPGDPDVVGATDLFFIDENTGIVTTTDGKLSRTTDGGQSWKGLLASPYKYGSRLIFADPEVGWTLDNKTDGKVSYTVDSGAHWNSRAFRFPTEPRAWTFPRRDRAYVVGEHGMVFRYRVVPAAEPTKPEVLVTMAMPGFASPLDDQAAQATAVLTELSTAVQHAPDSVAASPRGDAAAAAVDSTAEPPSAEEVVAEQSSTFIAGCCGKPVNKLNVVITAIAKSLPSFLAQYKNTNLLIAGLRMVTDLPGKFGDLRAALMAFKHAGDKDAAEAALAAIGSAAQAFHQTTKVAFQQELPAMETQSDAEGTGASQAPAAVGVVTDSAKSIADSTAARFKKEAEDKAKKGMGGLLKKKIRIP
ncbi:MAG: WD40/YVTN/BNR-like repeat-containing protein [Gemmatimonadales bacterium]